MGPDVVAVRQNLVPLVAGGQPTALATSATGRCGEHWGPPPAPTRSPGWSPVAVRCRGHGRRALVYVTGPLLTPTQLAQLLVHRRRGAGHGTRHQPDVDRARHLRPGPDRWSGLPRQRHPTGPDDGAGPATYFDPSWPRDFVTLSAGRRPRADGCPGHRCGDHRPPDQRRASTRSRTTTTVPRPRLRGEPDRQPLTRVGPLEGWPSTVVTAVVGSGAPRPARRWRPGSDEGEHRVLPGCVADADAVDGRPYRGGSRAGCPSRPVGSRRPTRPAVESGQLLVGITPSMPRGPR